MSLASDVIDSLGRAPRTLDGATVVLTGAAGGLGRSLARAFGSVGARLALCDREAPALASLAEQLVAAGIACSTHAFDIADEVACGRAFAEIDARWGAVDVLVNNAGITHRSLFSETEPAVIRKVMAVNLFGAVNCTKAALAGVIERRGAIVTVSSVAGFAPLVGRTGYVASKHALHGFFDTLRAELAGTGVDVLMVCPSFIDTPIEQNALGGSGGATSDGGRVMIGRPMTPDDVAAKIVAALRRRRRLLLPNRVATVAWWLARVAPPVYERLMRRSQGGAFD